MKISFALGQRGPISREKAWAAFVMNLTMPGFGSLMAGRKSGYPQAILVSVGLLISLAFGGQFLIWTVKNWERIHDPYGDAFEKFHEIWLAMKWPLLGLGIFGVAWLWALATGWSIMLGARRAPPPLPRRTSA